MKTFNNLFSLLVIAALATMASCSGGDDEIDNDITNEIVGTYTGTYVSQFFALSIVDERIKVSKVADDMVRVDPIDDGLTESFLVKIKQVDDGYLFTIEEQNSIYLGALRGYDGIPGKPDNHGSYTSATEFLAYGIWLTISGVDYTEVFTGYKD